jgi:hypothetical protein
MKLLMLILASSSFAWGAAPGDGIEAAKAVRFRAKEYSITLGALGELAKATLSTPDQQTERDLQICQLIGESKSDLVVLENADLALEAALNSSPEKVHRIDQADFAVIQSRSALPRFCTGMGGADYRNVGVLLGLLNQATADVNSLLALVNEYFPK